MMTTHPAPGTDEAAAAASASGDLARHPSDGWIPPDPCPMGRGSRAVLRGAIRAICPLETGPGGPGMVDRVEHQVRIAMACMPRGTARMLVALMYVFDFAPLWRFEALRRLRSLPRERAAAVLEGVMNSRSDLLRNIFFPIRGVLQSAYYDQPEVHEAIGYEPVTFMRTRITLRERLMAGAETDTDDLLKGGPR
ncbi:MAG: hypothetical protein ACQEXJ_03845 [Myxococcota bacterium]